MSCGESDELRAALPVDVPLVDEAQVRLVDQRRALEGVIRALAAQLPVGETSQLPVYQGHELGERTLVAGRPGDQQLRHPRVTRFVHVLLAAPFTGALAS